MMTLPTDPATGLEVYRNTRHRRVRLLHLGFWLAGAALLIGGLALHAVGGDGDPTVLFIMAPILWTCAAGLELYRSRYVTRLLVAPAGLTVETLAFLGRRVRRLAWDGVSPPSPSRDWHARGQVSSAVLIRARGLSLPFIVDTTDDALDLPTLRRAHGRERSP